MQPGSTLEGAVEEIEETSIEVNRDRLLQHLRRIYCHKGLPEVILSGPLSSSAVAWSTDICAATPGLPEVESLAAPVAVKLGLLISTLSCLDSDRISLRVERDEVVLAGVSRRIRHRTVDKDLTQTYLAPEKVLALVPDDAWCPFSADVAKGVVQAIRALGPEDVAFRVGTDGMTIIVGDPFFHSVEFDVPEVTSETPYALMMTADRIQSVFAEVGDSQPAIAPTGPNAFMGVRFQSQDGEVEITYVLSPRSDTRGPDGVLPQADLGPHVGA